MAKYVLCYVLVALVFGALDFLWLSLAGPHLYRPALGPLLSDKVRVAPAALFYLLYVGGLIGFVAAPALKDGDWGMALVRGAAFGLVAYAAYDLTNQATMRVWSTQVTVADLAWGAFASAVASGAGVYATARASAALGWS
jgi:uncharacterized membrane protein